MILASLDLIEKNKVRFMPQNEKEATYAKKIDKKEAKINWNEKARLIVAKINALNPNPGTWFKLHGNRVKVTKAREIQQIGKPGLIINKDFTITDFPGAGRFGDGLDHPGCSRVGDGDFKFDFGNKINCIFCSSVCFSVTGLSAEAFHFTHHHAADTDLRHRFAHVFELEGFDRCNN